MNHLKKYYEIHYYKSSKVAFEDVPPYQLEIIRDSAEFKEFMIYVKKVQALSEAAIKFAKGLANLNDALARSWMVFKDLNN